MISADTMGRVHAAVDTAQLRDGLHQVYSRLKRNKTLPLNLGLDVATNNMPATVAIVRDAASAP